MSEPDDHDLLARYARENSEAAFTALAERHVHLVYSTALRSVGNAHAAEEIAQAVFIILADKAEKLSRRAVLPGWLYQTTRLTAANFLRGEIRRQKREQEAFMQSTLQEPADDPAWRQIAPLLDNALDKLGERDRNAIVLRFFENKNLRDVGLALGASEDAAKMRVNRALEKLRKFFTKRGVTLSGAVIAGAVSANSVQAAPAGLAKTISAVAVAKGAAAGGSTLALVKGVLKIMAWTKAKTAVVIGMVVLVAAGTTTVAVKEFNPSFGTDKYFLEMGDWKAFQKIPPYLIVRPTHFNKSVINGTSAMGNDSRAIGRNMDFEEMIYFAYNFHNPTRTVLPAEKLPAGRFDFLVTVPGALEKFQAEIKRRFGYEARKEIRDADVLLLKVREPNAPGLKASRGNIPSRHSGETFIDWSSYPALKLAGQIEGYLSIPVVDQTGLTGNYDIQLDWKRGSLDIEKAELRQAVLDQLGLELIPTNMPIEMFIVEKANWAGQISFFGASLPDTP